MKSENVALYVRVSTDEQQTDQQRHQLERWVETTVPNADRLEPILAELTRAAENEWSAEDHHELTMAEFRAVRREMAAIRNLIEVQT